MSDDIDKALNRAFAFADFLHDYVKTMPPITIDIWRAIQDNYKPRVQVTPYGAIEMSIQEDYDVANSLLP